MDFAILCITFFTRMFSRLRKRSSSYDLKVVMTQLQLPAFTETIIDGNIRLFEQDSVQGSQRPLAIVLGWLMGKPQHVQKYTEIYLSEGFDVIQVQALLKDLMWTKNAKTLAIRILCLCKEEKRETSPIFIHALSVGCYIYTEMIIHSMNNQQRFHDFPDRLCGQIFDSPVDAPTASKAVSRATSNSPILQAFIKSTIDCYLSVFRKTKRDLKRATKVFGRNVYGVPTKFLYSLDDQVVVPSRIEALVENMVNKGINVKTETWKNASHVTIYRNNPDDYRISVKSFIDQFDGTRVEQLYYIHM